MANRGLGTLSISLVAETAGFVHGMSKAERESKKFRKEIQKNLKHTSEQLQRGLKVSAAAAAAAIGALTAATIQQTRAGLANVDAQAKLARSLNTTYDSVTALQIAFEEGGVDGFERSLNRLNRRLGAAEAGTGAAAKTVEELGLNLAELSGLEADERIARIADAIVDSGVSAQRAARFVQDLGFEQKEAAQLFLQGGDAIRAYRQQVDEFGLSLSELDTAKVEKANDDFARAGRLFNAISQQLAVNVAPILSAVSDLFIESAKEAGGLGEATADTFNLVIEASAEAVNSVAKLDRQFLRTQAALDVFALQVRNGFLEIAREIVEIPTGAVNELIGLLNKVGADIEPLGLSTIGREVQGLIDGTNDEILTINDTLREELAKPLPGDQFKRFVFEARQAADESARAAIEIRENFDMGGGGYTSPTSATDRDAQAKLEQDLAKRLDTLRQSFETEKQTVLRIYKEQEEEIAELRNAGVLSEMEAQNLKWQNEQEMFERRKELREQELEEEKSYWQQWLDAAQSNLQNFDDLSKTVIDNFTTGFGSAIEGLVFDAESLDDALKGIAETILRGVVNSLAQMAAQWLALQAVQAIVGTSATAATVGQAAISAAAWAPAAAAASLATLGTNAAPASAALVSTNALSKTLALTGMAHDGIDSVPQTGTWLLEKGERVMTSETSKKLDQKLEGGSGVVVNLYEDASKAGQVQQGQRDDGTTEVNVFVSDIMSNGPRAKAMQRAYGLRRQGT